jgi:FBP C-terminal treble-clef zinc-finger
VPANPTARYGFDPALRGGLAFTVVEPLTEQEIRAAFVNCSKGEAKRLHVPRDLAGQPWDDLDFLGWRDPRAPDRAYLVADLGDGPVAITLRCTPGQKRANLCSICLTSHAAGVTLMVAPRTGKAGQQGNSVGAYICGDLACSLYTRGKKFTASSARFQERLTLEEQVDWNVANLAAFLAKITA